jgi:UDP-N-acetylmuramoyl-tripeptide--D-alanyl-D-alanine ligase
MHKRATIQELYALYLGANSEVCTDTRKLVKGSMFFALKGENFNAAEFAQQAIDNGCSVAVVDDEKYAGGKRVHLVDDSLAALQALANYHRRQHNIPVLAITGSNGKTTNKELINAVLSQKFKVLATKGNLNNHIGVPLTLLGLRQDHEIAIIEMGANHLGEIALLSNIAEPGYGLITNIGKAHLEGFGGYEGVKKGKSELFRYLHSASGKAFVNGDDEVVNGLAADNDKYTYGCRKLYDVIGKDCGSNETVSLKYTTRYGEKDWSKLPLIRTSIIGNYNFVNCLAAVCVGTFFKVPEESIQRALENYIPDMNRSQLADTGRNVLILDAYNANPDSMSAAIRNFARHPAENKMLLLGDMFELGEYSGDEHQKIVEMLQQNTFRNVILVGEEFYKAKGHEFQKFRTTAECREYLAGRHLSGFTILVKGSRGMKMELLQEVL